MAQNKLLEGNEMKFCKFNESAADADIRYIIIWAKKHLNIEVTRNARRLKSALDKFEEQQLKRERVEQSELNTKT